MAARVWVLIAAVAAGCGTGEGDPADPGGTPDAAIADPGTVADPGPIDLGAPDPGTPDLGTPDLGTPDLGTPDPGALDPGSPADVPPPSLQPVSPAALQAGLANKDFLLINVHVPYEGKIAGTDALIPYNDPEQLRAYLGDDLDVAAVLYCLSNAMSTLAGNRLVSQDGYRNLRYLDGGMLGWKAAGFPLEP